MIFIHVKTGLHEPQLSIERRITLVSSIVVKRCRCALQVSSVAQLQLKKLKPGLHEPQLQVEWSVTFVYSVVVEQRY